MEINITKSKNIENDNDNKWKKQKSISSIFIWKRRPLNLSGFNAYLKLEFKMNVFSEPLNWGLPEKLWLYTSLINLINSCQQN